MTVGIEELAQGSAFIVMHPEHHEILVTVSGPYLTLYQVNRAAEEWDAVDGLNPIHHDEGGSDGDGLYKITAADLLDQARQVIADYAEGTGLWAPDPDEED